LSSLFSAIRAQYSYSKLGMNATEEGGGSLQRRTVCLTPPDRHQILLENRDDAGTRITRRNAARQSLVAPMTNQDTRESQYRSSLTLPVNINPTPCKLENALAGQEFRMMKASDTVAFALTWYG
jgi:hypothetical protein